MTERLYTTAEAAAALDIPVKLIATWKQRGRIQPADSIKGTGRAGVAPLYRLSELRPLADAYQAPDSGRIHPMSLTEFLLARIAEDEAAANAAHRESMRGHAGPGFSRSRVAWVTQAEDVRGHVLIERFSPVRVLAECETKRRIMGAHQQELGPSDEVRRCSTCDPRFFGAPCSTIRALALPYADHPDYREEWKP